MTEKKSSVGVSNQRLPCHLPVVLHLNQKGTVNITSCVSIGMESHVLNRNRGRLVTIAFPLLCLCIANGSAGVTYDDGNPLHNPPCQQIQQKSEKSKGHGHSRRIEALLGRRNFYRHRFADNTYFVCWHACAVHKRANCIMVAASFKASPTNRGSPLW